MIAAPYSGSLTKLSQMTGGNTGFAGGFGRDQGSVSQAQLQAAGASGARMARPLWGSTTPTPAAPITPNQSMVSGDSGRATIAPPMPSMAGLSAAAGSGGMVGGGQVPDTKMTDQTVGAQMMGSGGVGAVQTVAGGLLPSMQGLLRAGVGNRILPQESTDVASRRGRVY